MNRYKMGDAIIFVNESRTELCRLTSEFSDEAKAVGGAAAAQVLLAVDSNPLLVNALTRLTEKVERAGTVTLSKEDFDELASIAKDAREVLAQATISKHVLTMRSKTTAGTDMATLDVHLGQDVLQVAERVAASYGAKVVSVTRALS
jgi:hypothetical protein